MTFDSLEVFRVIVLGTLLIRSGFRLETLGIGSVVDNFLFFSFLVKHFFVRRLVCRYKYVLLFHGSLLPGC